MAEEIKKPTGAVRWEKYKNMHVGFDGNQIVSVVGRSEDFPCEAYQIQAIHGMYATLESAQVEAEKDWTEYIRREEPQQSFNQTLVATLKSVLVALEKPKDDPK